MNVGGTPVCAVVTLTVRADAAQRTILVPKSFSANTCKQEDPKTKPWKIRESSKLIS